MRKAFLMTMALLAPLAVAADEAAARRAAAEQKAMAEALRLHQYRDYQQALERFRALASKGNGAAMSNIGYYYDQGLGGLPVDPARAAEWYRRAAEAGDRDGQYNLAAMYEGGEGVPQDYERAMHWYLEAAHRGLMDALIAVGLMHEEGLGVPADPVEAFAWFYAAAANGSAPAKAERERVAARLTEGQLEAGRDRGDEIYKAEREQWRHYMLQALEPYDVSDQLPGSPPH